MDKIYNFDENTFKKYIGKNKFIEMRIFKIIFIFAFLIVIANKFITLYEIIDIKDYIPYIDVYLICFFVLSLYYYFLSKHMYAKLKNSLSDYKIVIDKSCLYLCVNETKNINLLIYQCYEITRVTFLNKYIKINGTIAKNGLTFEKSLQTNRSFTNEIILPRVFNEEAEQMLKSKVQKEGENGSV